MGGEVFTKGNRSALVEKDAHSSRFERAGGVLQHGTDLRACDTREPDNKVRDLRPVFEVLEQGRDRDTGTVKNPNATHALVITFYGRAGRPFNHAAIVTRRRGDAILQPVLAAGSFM